MGLSALGAAALGFPFLLRLCGILLIESSRRISSGKLLLELPYLRLQIFDLLLLNEKNLDELLDPELPLHRILFESFPIHAHVITEPPKSGSPSFTEWTATALLVLIDNPIPRPQVADAPATFDRAKMLRAVSPNNRAGECVEPDDHGFAGFESGGVVGGGGVRHG